MILRRSAYGTIVASYSRRKLLDRMIAAQALVHRADLNQFNPDDSVVCQSISALPSLAAVGSEPDESRALSRANLLVIPADVAVGCSLALLVAASAVNIFKPNNIVFGEIGTRLHLNEKGRNLPRI